MLELGLLHRAADPLHRFASSRRVCSHRGSETQARISRAFYSIPRSSTLVGLDGIREVAKHGYDCVHLSIGNMRPRSREATERTDPELAYTFLLEKEFCSKTRLMA